MSQHRRPDLDQLARAFVALGLHEDADLELGSGLGFQLFTEQPRHPDAAAIVEAFRARCGYEPKVYRKVDSRTLLIGPVYRRGARAQPEEAVPRPGRTRVPPRRR